MADIPRSRAVYRLLIGMKEERGDFRSLTIETDDLTEVVRWQLSNTQDSYQNELNAEWVGDPSWRPVEFSPRTAAPVVGVRIAEMFRADFEAAGTLQPLVIDGEESKEWFAFLVEKVVDCLDAEKSSEPEWDGTIRKSVFRADAVPVDLPAFRVPQSTNIHWNGWMVDRLMKLVALDVEARLIWSDDPTREPHPDPWGF
ncbi:hypothetical protein FXN61_24635 [Lentzea sp. PSKA42]|uniref:Uncharacterized protein n=2 Tax=Lentzea indica TaxID=2604800 RepID=A0ABX1FLY1_9PSEU|nr:hypothetical protein [Lentzea indica]